MKKIIVCLLTICALLSFASCSMLSDLNTAVKYPDAFSITYEVTSSDGTISTIKKTVDENGNVFYKDSTHEVIYLLEASSYVKYEKNADGVFVKHSGEKYTKKVVEEATSGIKAYAEESKNKFMPTAKQESDTEMHDRTCEVYKLGVGTENNSSYTYYYVDKETGICLGTETKNTALGNTVAYDGERFMCTEFLVDNIDDISKLIK